MKPLKRFASVIYLLACLVVLGSYAASFAGPFAERMAELRGELPFRVTILVCLGIIAVQALYVLGLVLFHRPPATCVHPGGHPDIEVTREAIGSVARAAAAADEDVMIESVAVRVEGRTHAAARVEIEAIALDDTGLEGRAHRMRQRVEEACEQMLGTPGIVARVRFLPSRTVTVTREVSDDR